MENGVVKNFGEKRHDRKGKQEPGCHRFVSLCNVNAYGGVYYKLESIFLRKKQTLRIRKKARYLYPRGIDAP